MKVYPQHNEGAWFKHQAQTAEGVHQEPQAENRENWTQNGERV